MFHIRSEGEYIKNGFNFYPLSDKRSFGFVFRLGKYINMVRFSKFKKKLNVRKINN